MSSKIKVEIVIVIRGDDEAVLQAFALALGDICKSQPGVEVDPVESRMRFTDEPAKPVVM